MSDIKPAPAVKLDAAGKKRIDDAAALLAGLKVQAAALEKLGIMMPAIKEQIAWAEKAHETLIKEFT